MEEVVLQYYHWLVWRHPGSPWLRVGICRQDGFDRIPPELEPDLSDLVGVSVAHAVQNVAQLEQDCADQVRVRQDIFRKFVCSPLYWTEEGL